MVLLSQAAKPIIGALPALPPSTANPYTGTELTATVRASLQHALDSYKPGLVNLNLRVGGDLSRSDTRSFGESHASELSSLASPAAEQDSHPGLSLTPPIPDPTSTRKEDHPSTQLPSVESASAVTTQPAVGPTATGAGKSPSEDLYGTAFSRTESAEEEKQRLAREERERVLAAGQEVDNQCVIGSESAEEEKKRLEREERERVLAGGANASKNTAERDGDELPPYQDLES